MTDFGPNGEDVFYRTYSRTKPDGTKETWPETVERVVDGNLALVDERHHLPGEREKLVELMTDFKILPAGRHLWASGVKGRQYLFNCHVSGWDDDVTEHFAFTFLRLMEGGGVGANYSNRYLDKYPPITNLLSVHVVCDPDHPDYEAMVSDGLLSGEYDANWPGSFEVEDSREGWAAALTELLTDYYRDDLVHENRVFDVSRVRKAGARLKSFGGTASGPAPLARMLQEVSLVMNRELADNGWLSGMGAMSVDHAIAQCVVAGGNRRSARMAIMHWDDWQIDEFLYCKADTGEHWTTNISVEVDDEFFQQAQSQHGDWLASDILEDVAAGMLDNGEPGIWNSSHANIGEPNPVQATNPCGEICLEPWENCNLGHVNLGAFVLWNRFDYLDALVAHRLMTRFLIRATYGDVRDAKQADVLARNRRIGVGHFGFAAYLALRGIRYADALTTTEVQNMLGEMADCVDNEAARFAHELRIPVPVKTRTVAPTGTIAKLPGTTEGIHPIFSRYFIRRIRFSTVDPDQVAKLEEYRQRGYRVEPCQYAANTAVVEFPTKDSLYAEVEQRLGKKQADRVVQAAHELTLTDMLNTQLLYQRFWADNAVSYTANIDPEKYTVNDLTALLSVYGPELKGATVFPELSRPQSPYETITEAEYEAAVAKDVADSVDEECASGACPVR